MPISVIETAPERAEPVREWRLEQLEAAGYPHLHALMISERLDIDLHLACGLLAQACPVELALRILL